MNEPEKFVALLLFYGVVLLVVILSGGCATAQKKKTCPEPIYVGWDGPVTEAEHWNVNTAKFQCGFRSGECLHTLYRNHGYDYHAECEGVPR